jgi:hypothetical protein
VVALYRADTHCSWYLTHRPHRDANPDGRGRVREFSCSIQSVGALVSQARAQPRRCHEPDRNSAGNHIRAVDVRLARHPLWLAFRFLRIWRLGAGILASLVLAGPGETFCASAYYGRGAGPAGLRWTSISGQRPHWCPGSTCFRTRQSGRLVVNHFCANWTLYLMLSWLPSYFRDVQHMSIEGSGLFSILPWVSQFVVGNASAHVADNMIARGWRVTHVRKIMQCTGLGGGAVFLLLASQAATPGFALFTMCGALGIGSLCWAGFASNHLDIAPRHADVLWSISNTAGTLPGHYRSRGDGHFAGPDRRLCGNLYRCCRDQCRWCNRLVDLEHGRADCRLIASGM